MTNRTISMKLKPNIASLPPYVPGKTAYNAVKLSSNENPLGPSPLALQAIRDNLQTVHRYPDGASTELRKALAQLWVTSPDNLIIANGSDEVFSLLSAAWLSPGENAVIASQTFSQYHYAIQLFGGETRKVNLCQGKHDLESMLLQVDEQTRMVFICNPNNPTGTYVNSDELESFMRRLPKNVIVVLDEAYAEFADSADFPDSKSLLKKFDNLVVVRTFSKLYGLAGMRVGYGVGNALLTSGAEQASMPFKVNLLAQSAALAALGDHDHRRRTLELVRNEKTFLAAEFARRGYIHYPTQANFICFGVGVEARLLWEPLASRGIAVRDLKSFGLPALIRYTFGLREHNERLLSILDDVLSDK